MDRMRLPDSAHIMQPWRIHAIAPDFQLEDVWALPTPGTPDDFPRLLELMAESDPEEGGSPVVRLLFAIRWKVGALLGWDDQASVPTLRDRLPEDLRGTAPKSRSRSSRSRRCTGPRTSSRPRSPTRRCTASCTLAGSGTARRWPCW